MTRLVGTSLLLRPVTRCDYQRQREFFRDADVAWLDSSSPEAYERIDVEALFETDPSRDCLRLGIEIGGEYVGFCSLMNLTNPAKVFELGINIGDRRYWNRGFGREVVALLLEHGFRDLGATEIRLTTNSKNERAIRCFQAAGFEEKKRIRDAVAFGSEQADMIEMSIDVATWGRPID